MAGGRSAWRIPAGGSEADPARSTITEAVRAWWVSTKSRQPASRSAGVRDRFPRTAKSTPKVLATLPPGEEEWSDGADIPYSAADDGADDEGSEGDELDDLVPSPVASFHTAKQSVAKARLSCGPPRVGGFGGPGLAVDTGNSRRHLTPLAAAGDPV